jgi:hypothetical protein
MAGSTIPKMPAESENIDSKEMKLPSRRVWSMAFDPQDPNPSSPARILPAFTVLTGGSHKADAPARQKPPGIDLHSSDSFFVKSRATARLFILVIDCRLLLP